MRYEMALSATRSKKSVARRRRDGRLGAAEVVAEGWRLGRCGVPVLVLERVVSGRERSGVVSVVVKGCTTAAAVAAERGRLGLEIEFLPENGVGEAEEVLAVVTVSDMLAGGAAGLS